MLPQASASPWIPSGIVTLTTDFSLVDPYVGIMKGVLHAQFRGVTVVDVTHGVAAQDVAGGSFALASAWRWFPPGSVHVAVVDPGVGTPRRIALALEAGHAFLAPDNGLLPPLLSPAAQVFELDVERVALKGRSNTFHGRDVFAPAAARLASGVDPRSLGRVLTLDRLVPAERPQATRTEDGGWRARVRALDHYGNAITDLSARQLAPSDAGAWSVLAAGRTLCILEAYGQAPVGGALVLLDSFDCWEVAVRDGSAARELGLAPGDEVLFLPRSPQAR